MAVLILWMCSKGTTQEMFSGQAVLGRRSESRARIKKREEEARTDESEKGRYKKSKEARK